MAKRKAKPEAVVKLLVTGGQASTMPPVGQALSQVQVNPGQFVSQFNEKTKDRMGVPLRVIVRVYRDRTFDIEIKTPPTSFLVKRAAGIAQGSGAAKRETVGAITPEQVREIAEEKMQELNASDIEMAMRMVEGTARSCGVEVKEA